MTQPRVFISYCHTRLSGEDMKGAVLELANHLRMSGVDARVDQYLASPPPDWQEWMWTEMQDAAAVLVVCSDAYKARAESPSGAGIGTGTAWESQVLTGALYADQSARGRRFIPAVIGGARQDQVPYFLAATTVHNLADPASFENLLRQLFGVPQIALPVIGPPPAFVRMRGGTLAKRHGALSVSASAMWEGHLEIWVLDPTGAIKHRWIDAFTDTWSEWHTLPPPEKTTVQALANVGSRLHNTERPGRQDAFALGDHGDLFHAHWTDATGWSEWSRIP